MIKFKVANERAKNIIRSQYNDFICTLPLESTDEHGNKYYSFIPTKYIELKDALDIDKLIFSPHPIDSPFVDGTYDLVFSNIVKYCFKDIVKSYPVFRLKQSGFNKITGEAVTLCEAYDIFVLEEFVRLIEDNKLTGFKFEEVYDSETFAPNEKIEAEITAPAEEIPTFNREKCTAEKLIIPMTHEDGVFAVGVLGQSSDESLTIEHFGSMITNSANRYKVYDIGNCDTAKDIEVTYRGGRLGSVYVNSGKEKIPVYLCFDFLPEGKSEELTKAVNECVESCSEDMLKALENARKPIEPLSFEYYYDDEEMDINLQDSSCNIFSIENTASHLLRCICNCAWEQCPYNNDFGFEVFGRIMAGVRKKLAEEIPKRFEVSDDFKIYEPEMYD
ncbi:MAG: hypothetical protein NC120_10105 [Ruminococcus sp.]|nr:hypothetical protein [Ruminococcus sp.]